MKKIISFLFLFFSSPAIFAAEVSANNSNFLFWQTQGMKLVFILLAAWIAYKFGMQKYLHQRGHEQITKRYLEDGVDLVIEGIEHALGVWRENFAHSLRILKNFREKQKLGITLNPNEYDGTQFRRYKQELFYFTPFYKLQTIIGDTENIFHSQTCRLFAFVEKVNNFCQYDLCVAIKEFVEGGTYLITAEELCKQYKLKIEEYGDEASKYYTLIGELQNIAWIIETNAMLLEDMEKLKDRRDIKDCMKRLKKTFEDKEKTK